MFVGSMAAEQFTSCRAHLRVFHSHPEYKTWKQIGSTERIENHTMRIVLGNDVAVKEIAGEHINPWPDGAMIGEGHLARTAGSKRSGRARTVRSG